MKKHAPKIGDLKIADTQNGNDCMECALRPWCDAACDLPIFKHYELIQKPILYKADPDLFMNIENIKD